MNLDFKELLKVWGPPLLGILLMLVLGFWSDVARYFLFTHHLFWMIGVILLINPIAQMLSSSPSQKGTTRPELSQSVKAQPQMETHKSRVEQEPTSAAETLAERLARLQQQKKAVDRIIEQLSTRNKEDK